MLPEDEWELVKAVGESDRLATVNLYLRSSWYHHQLKQFIDEGELGELAIIRICHMTPGLAPGEGHEAEGPSFHDCGMHYCDITRWYAQSEFKTMHSQALRMWNYKDPWWLQAHGTFDNGIVYDITQGFVYGQMSKDQTHNSYIDLIGTHGIARMTHDFKTAVVKMHGEHITQRMEKPYGDKNIDRLCLAPRAQLRNETMVLLESTMRKSRIYVDLFRLLSRHKYGVQKHKALEQLGYSASQFARAVDEVVRCGYVRQYRNMGLAQHPKFLMLVDPFILFHFSFIDSANGVVPHKWSDFVADQGRFNAWRGNAFEVVCLYHVGQIKAALGIGGVETKEYPWHSARHDGGAQIDLVIERADRIANLCEMKFTDLPYEL